ncbi:MAG: hypothetical protein WCF53_11775, partial [Pseudolabrys sp.]
QLRAGSCRSGSEGVQLRQGPKEELPQRIPWLLPDPAGVGLRWIATSGERSRAASSPFAI